MPVKRASAKSSKAARLASAKRASSMEELLARTGYQFPRLSRGQEVSGRVVEITSKSLILDIGAKSDGVVEGAEFLTNQDFIKKLKVGGLVSAIVLVPEAESGQVLLSIRPAAEDQAWDEILAAQKRDLELEAKIDQAIRGGLSALVLGISGFIPTSHLSRKLAEKTQESIGKTVKVKVVEAERSQQRLILSEKAVAEAGFLNEQKKALKKIKVGARLQGRVVSLTDFGAFVQIAVDGTPLDGLVHLSELSWEKVAAPAEVVREGDEVEVVVIGKEKGKLALSIKKAREDPWSKVAAKYKVDQKITGKVTKIGDFGALIQLFPGIEGLLHLSKIPPGKVLHEGDSVECFIENIDPQNRRISLGLVLKEKPIGYK